MKLPKSIKVGPTTYGLSVLPEHDDDFGHCRVSTLSIAYNKDQSDQSLIHTIVHESLHAMIYSYGIRQQFSSPQQEENLVSSLEPALIAWIRDNPALLKLILDVKQ